MELEQIIGRLEGKMDLVIANQCKSDQSLSALHKRVDRVEKDMSELDTENKLFKRDVKWITGVACIVVGAVTWILDKVFK